MKRLAFSAIVLLVAGCATVQGPPPLTPPDLVALAKSGATAPQLIEELKRTNTVLFLSATDVIRLHEAGVPMQVLDYLQQQAYDEMRWRDYQARMFWSGPYWRGYPGWGPCPPGWRGRHGPWGC